MPLGGRLARTGTTWLGLYKSDVRFSAAPKGYTLSAGDGDAKWDGYLRESILDPGAKIVLGYQNVMPPYAAQFSGTAYKDKKLAAIVEYIKSLDNHGPSGKPKYFRPMKMPAKDRNKESESRARACTPRKPHRNPRGKHAPYELHHDHLHHRQLPDAYPRNRLVDFTLDHKRIGVMYLVSVLVAFLLGGIVAMLIRTQLLRPDGRAVPRRPTCRSSGAYNELFTLHGALMIFLVLIPGTPGALGNFVLPIMLGAKDVAFPRVNLWSYYFYVMGAALALASIVLGGVDTGWTFYTPYSTQTRGAVICLVFGAFVLGFSSIFTGINFIVTIHKLRPTGMTWFRMPLFLWGLYATAIIQIVATPVLGITLLLLILERLFHLGIFNPDYGGDPILFQHFFWFYSHPAVYIMILPGMGIMSEVIATSAAAKSSAIGSSP